ncbi:MAG: PVC-type heme-binding CxxCH protein [Ginsengibacter sp.]
MNKVLPGLLALLIILGSSCKRKHYSDPLTPEKALASFQLNQDFNIEIFVAEPFVKDPIAMAFDDHGNAFVVEMPDYPFPVQAGKGKERIRMLIDTNKDGRIDKSIVFADSLSEATSILPWKEGLIVTAAPDIFYLKDTNGDFRADLKEILFTGFFKGNSEGQITGLLLNIDNWIYAANDGQAGNINADSGAGKPTLAINGTDFRFRMDSGKFESESGNGQFGQTVDDWGHRFFTQNSNHIQQAIIPWRYLHRHPYMPTTSVVIDITDHEQFMKQLTPAPYWRAERTRRRNTAYREQHLDRIEYADGHFTGAAGGIIYGGDAYPQKYYGNYFVADVAGNLVHRDVLSPSDSLPIYVAKRDDAEKEKEFLASTDPWFRPVNFTVGSDGCLYIIDMYRQHIETPFAIDEDLKKEMDFMNGSEYGRIYRIVPKNKKLQTTAYPDFQKMGSLELIKFLSHTNKQFRFQVQRILVERQDKSIVPAVKAIFNQDKNPRARLHALYVLEGLHALDPNLVKQAIKDTHPGVRESGIRLGEQYQECLPEIIESAKDSSILVTFQAALTLGNYPVKQSGAALSKLLVKYGQDSWFRTAILSSEAGSSTVFFEMLVQQGWFANDAKQGQVNFLEEFSNILSLRNHKEEIIKLIKTISNAPISKQKKYQVTAFRGLAKGYKDSENKPKADPVLKETLKNMLKISTENEVKDAIQTLIKSLQ